MRSSIAILALAGSAIAAPWNHPEYKEVKNVHVVYETVVHTVFHTEGEAQPTKVAPVYQAPAVATTVVYEENVPVHYSTKKVVYETYSAAPVPTKEPATSEAPAPTSTKEVVYETYSAAPVPTKEPATSAAPAPAPTSSAAPAPAPSSGYQAVVDTWRAKMGMKALTNDAKLQSNAMDTVVSSNGEMVHKLNPGSFGQVLAPGNADDFEHVFVGGWLCELPGLAGLDGVCSTQSEGWSYNGQTGHAEILTSDSYTKIGCALHAGIWCCDVA